MEKSVRSEEVRGSSPHDEKGDSSISFVPPVRSIPQALNFGPEIVIPVGNLNHFGGVVKTAMKLDSHFPN